MTAIQFSNSIIQLSEPLMRYALSLTKNSEDANDLLQETTFKALKNSDKFKLGTNLKAWLYTIMRNQFINKYRKAKRKPVVLDGSDTNYLIDSNDRYKVRNEGDSDILMEELMGFIESLRKEHKEPFLMNYRGYKYDEIATKLGLPLGTVKSRIFLARKQVQKMIKNHYNVEHHQELTRSA